MDPNWEKMLAKYKHRAGHKRRKMKRLQDDIDNSILDDAKPIRGEVKRELL
jgi:hypothetical protein